MTDNRKYRGLRIVVGSLVAIAALSVLVVLAGPRLAELPQGPDTKRAIAGFTGRFGYPPPPSVSDVYFTEFAWLDYSCRLRFTCSDPNQINQFIQALGLRPSRENRSSLASSVAPSWWFRPSPEQKSSLTYYHNLSTNSQIDSFINTQKVGQAHFLWHDRRDNHVYYYELSN